MGFFEDDMDELVKEAGWIGRKLVSLYNQHAWWSRKTFGTDQERGPKGPIDHLKKEILELEENPTDASEYADCFLLLLDASRRAGISLDGLIDAARHKMTINERREWQTPEPDKAVEHVRKETPQ